MARETWSKSETGSVWIPEPSRRAIIRGASVGAAALLLGCGEDGGGAAPGGSTDPGRAGGAGGGASSGGRAGSGSGGAPSAGGAPGTGGSASASGGAPGSGGSAGAAPGTGGDGAGGASGSGGASGVDGGGAADATVATDATGPVMATPSCIVRPRQILGPFPNKTMINRSDVRSEPGMMNPKPGLPLQVVFRVGQMAGSMCKGYQGVAVDYWQCDAGGVYSAYASEGTGSMNYLRGYQMTDSTGTAEFMSIFPGSYPGRAVHVHFTIRTAGGKSFTSQLYFPETLLSEVFAQTPYSAHKPMKNTQDSYYSGDGGAQLIPKMSKAGGGYVAEFTIGLA